MKIRSPETYWLLKNGLTRSYPSLKEDIECDILVVGGGITGALMAFQLSGEGYNTVLIDKNDVSLGSTAATTAILQYELDEQLHTLIDKVGEEAAINTYKAGVVMINWLNELVHHLHFDCGFEMKNSVYFSRNEEDVATLWKEFQCRAKHGFGVEWLTGAHLAKQYGIAGTGAIVSNKAAALDAYAFTHKLLHHAVTHSGLRVFDHTPLEEVRTKQKHPVVFTDTDCKISCKNIVYAAGYESEKFLDKPVAKLVSTYAFVSEPLKVIPPSIYTSVFWDTSVPYFYMRTTTDGRILVGGGDEDFTNPILRDALIDRKEQALMDQFRTTMPDMSITPDFSWAGTFGMTKDSMPYIGRHPEHEHSYLVLGYGGNGITFSLMAMKIISDSIAGRENRFNDYFKFNR
jgi:glycine/D-amino acid oxidase-like deaminating enzyme